MKIKTSKKDLQQDNDFFSNIVEKTEAIIYCTDLKGKITYVNPQFLKIIGYSEKVLKNRNIFDLVPKEYSDFVRNRYLNQIKNQIASSYLEFPIQTESGKIKWIGQSLTLFTKEDEIERLQCIAQDITLRKLIDQETLTLAKILEQTSEMVLITDKNGIIQYVNSTFEKVTQYPKEEVIGKNPRILNSGLQKKEFFKNLWDTINAGKIWRGVIKNRKKDGTLYDEEMTITPIYDEFGKLINFAAIKRDITKEIQQRLAVIRAEEKFRGIFENAVEGIYQSSVDGKLITANKALLQMLGYDSLEEMQKLDLTKTVYINPDDRAAFKAIMDRDGKVFDYELKLRRKDGKEIIGLENSRAVKDSEGKIIYYEGIIQDITKRKEAENEIRTLNAQKDKLFSIVSHDLRAPFNSILGFTEMLLDESTDFTPEEKKEFLVYIKQAAEQQLHLLNNLLDWSRLETGRIRFEPKPVELNQIINQSIISLLGNAHRKKIELFSNINEKVDVNVDDNLILQLFVNLLSNAIKFTPESGKVWIDLIEYGSDFIKIAVKDSGVGIPKEDFDKLFRIDTKYFSQGTSGEEGSGLGLSLCSEIIQKHGGNIYVESELNKGTSFIFTLPAVKQSILVVDDNKGDRSLSIRYVEQVLPNAIIFEANDGYEAMSLALSRIPSLILADFAMPGMDGLRLLKELRTQPQTKNIPVIIITSFESKADAATLLEYGVKEIFIKPVGREDLQKSIIKYLK